MTQEGDDEVQALTWVCQLCDGAVIDELQIAAARDEGRAEQAVQEAIDEHIALHVEELCSVVQCSFAIGDHRCTLPQHVPAVGHCPGPRVPEFLHHPRCGCRWLGH